VFYPEFISHVNISCFDSVPAGLSWEDDVTQQVLTNEFSKLRKVSLPLPEPR